MSDNFLIFNRPLKELQRNRAKKLLPEHDFLIREAAGKLLHHLEDIKKQFPSVLSVGEYSEFLGIENQAGTKTLARAYISESEELLCKKNKPEEDNFDLVISLLDLHWVNDLPGILIQIKSLLKKDGLFIASFFGGETLKELREAFTKAEMETTGGISPRISPMVDIRDAAALLQRAKFAIPVADSEKITVLYKDAFSLMKDLRAMGETNALIKKRKSFTTIKTLEKVAEKYNEVFANQEGLIPATFEIITISGSKD